MFYADAAVSAPRRFSKGAKLLISQIRARLDEHQDYIHDAADAHAAVLVALTNEADPQVVLTRRAAHLKRHPGEVAFPGGKWEEGDESLLCTALRESHEEVALEPHQVEVIQQLSTAHTRHKTRVVPYVGLIPTGLQLQPELNELECIFHVPFSFLADSRNLRVQQVTYEGEPLNVAYFEYEGFNIWGMTARILVELVNIVYGPRLIY